MCSPLSRSPSIPSPTNIESVAPSTEPPLEQPFNEDILCQIASFLPTSGESRSNFRLTSKQFHSAHDLPVKTVLNNLLSNPKIQILFPQFFKNSQSYTSAPQCYAQIAARIQSIERALISSDRTRSAQFSKIEQTMQNPDLFLSFLEASMALSRKAIEKASSLYGQKTTSLDLEACFDRILSVLPSELGKLTNIERLDLSDNYLEALPPEITQLQNLQRLYLPIELQDSLPQNIVDFLQQQRITPVWK